MTIQFTSYSRCSYEVLLDSFSSEKFVFWKFIVKLPAIEKTWRYVCTMTTHPNENTRRPCRQVRLSLAAGSVLMILLPLTVGLNASKHLSQNPEKSNDERATLKKFKNIRLKKMYRQDISMSTTFAVIFSLNRVLFLRMLRPLFDQLLTVLLSHRDSAVLIQILIHEIIGLVVVIRHARGLDVPHRRKRSVFIHGRADHQHQYRAADGSKVTV